MSKIGYVFLCKQYTICHSNSFDVGCTGIPVSRSLIFPYEVNQLRFGAVTPSPRISAAFQAEKVD